jgi:hypothetical protein
MDPSKTQPQVGRRKWVLALYCSKVFPKRGRSLLDSSYFEPIATIPSNTGVSRKTLTAPKARAEPPITKKWLK